MHDELSSFQQAMADVNPIKQNKAHISSKKSVGADFARKRAVAIQKPAKDSPLSDHVISDVGPHDIVDFKRSGIQHGVYRNLRLGKYPAEERLDLHQYSINEARVALYDFILQCQQFNVRCVMVLHGKGGRQGNGIAVLKSHVVHWLASMDAVMAYHSAPANQGGAGALYVLIGKSQDKTQRNRKLHGGKDNG